ncbi:nucleolar DEAD-box protein required for synthesis of 60S ribosomal subunit, partial [Coemansia sp. RSA 2708]
MDDFIMTISDTDEVPDLENGPQLEPETKPQTKRAGSKANGKGAKKHKADDEGDMAKGFAIDLETDGLDSVSQTLDFTLARASLKKRNNPNSFSKLDLKIAAVRRAAKKAKKEDQQQQKQADSDAMEESEAGSDEEAAAVEEAASSGSEEEDEGDDDEKDGEASESEASDEQGSEDESESDSESEVSSDSGSESEVDEAEEARKRAYFAPADEVPEDLPESFTLMNLARPVMKGLTKLGFSQPTPIQAKTIPVGLLGKDVCGGAQTGSGKTAAFLVPILERLLYRPKNVTATRVLILCPTRELAIQCHSVGTKLAGFTDITLCLCVGGLALKPQEAELRQRPDIVIATPGRLIDHLRNNQAFHLDTIEIL